MFTCPKLMVLRTGSSSRAAGSSQPTVRKEADPGRAAARNMRSTTAVSAMVARLSKVLAAVIGSSANGASSTAAIGG